jgi:hypothetical protein
VIDDDDPIDPRVVGGPTEIGESGPSARRERRAEVRESDGERGARSHDARSIVRR